ncbi:hypothetical protein ACHAWF_011364 [Thalassiosira exigua]
MAQFSLKPSHVIAITATISSSGCYIAYRRHNQRVLSDNEVDHARNILAQITPSPSSSLPQTKDSLTAQHFSNLDDYGVTVVKDTLNRKELVKWNRRAKDAFCAEGVVWNSGRAHCCISKQSAHHSDFARVGLPCECDVSGDRNTSERTNSSRLGFLRRKRINENESHATPPSQSPPPTTQPSLQDVVKNYFSHHGIKRYELTDLQYLNAAPQSTHQIWHRDNKFRGLTAIVALQNVRGNGPTELILKSHKDNFTLWPRMWNAILPTHQNNTDSISDQPLLGCIDAGDAILYDARIFHRGRGNNIDNALNLNLDEESTNDRPVLVLRWDAANTPPPGAGIIVTTANIYAGSMSYAMLFALRYISGQNANERG